MEKYGTVGRILQGNLLHSMCAPPWHSAVGHGTMHSAVRTHTYTVRTCVYCFRWENNRNKKINKLAFMCMSSNFTFISRIADIAAAGSATMGVVYTSNGTTQLYSQDFGPGGYIIFPAGKLEKFAVIGHVRLVWPIPS